MNANGSILGVPDAILTVDGNSNPTSETPTTKERKSNMLHEVMKTYHYYTNVGFCNVD